jgi:hypothetical protein
MLRNCLNCGKEFEGTARANFDTDKCRVAYNRNNRSVTKPDVTEKNVTENGTGNVTETMTKTDALFQQDAIDRGLGPDWLNMTIIREPNCMNCGKRFKTRLALLKYCSPDCRRKAYGWT